MDRRSFLLKGSLAGAGSMIMLNTPSLWAGSFDGEFFTYTPELPAYPLDALEPYIDAKTMEVHSGMHHKAYSSNLNTALSSAREEFRKTPLIQLFEQLDTLPEPLQSAIRNHGGGHWNHNFFWKCMTPDVKSRQPSEKLQSLIVRDFGSMENFKAEFKKASLSVFGSGWAWLVWTGVKVEIHKTPNQVNPLMNNPQGSLKPLLGVDVWEHAYYLKYQNRRAEYMDQFWNVVNWEFASSNLV